MTIIESMKFIIVFDYLYDPVLNLESGKHFQNDKK